MANEFIVKNGIILKSGTIEIGDATTTGYTFPSTDGTNGQVLTTDGSGSVTFQTPSGGSSVNVERLRVVYDGLGQLSSIDNTTSGINSAVVATTTEIDVTFTGYSYPPISMMTYGYNTAGTPIYQINHVNSSYTTRNIDANGGAAFGSLTSSEVLTLNMQTSNTGASNSQHAWLVMLFGS